MTRLTNKLMNIDCDFWELMDIESGSDFMNEDGTMNELFDAFCRTVEKELEKMNIESVSKKVYSELEDSNYHTMNRVLVKLGKIA